MATRRNLKAHKGLLLDVIKRQAGSLHKAGLEGIMNALEAGSGRVFVGLDCNGAGANEPGAIFRLRDEGQGFRNEEEIVEWFETFGTPQDECPRCKQTMQLQDRVFICSCGYTSDKKTWAQFRMGRGQLFAFGRNIWRTGEFEMLVDIDKMEVDYDLETGLSPHQGCDISIDLYKNPIGTYQYRSIEAFESAIRKQIEFMEGEIHFNNTQINTPASTLKWDFEDDDAYYLWGKGMDLSFYNLGAYVMNWPASRAGVTGTIVSKEQLKVNFARNDVQSDCEVYERIQEVVKANRIRRVRKSSRRLNSDERISTLCDIRDGDCIYDEVKTLGLFRTSSGKTLTLDAIRKIRSPWTFADYGDRVADKLMQTGGAVCLDRTVIDLLDYKGNEGEFFGWLLNHHFMDLGQNLQNAWGQVRRMYHAFDGTEGLSDGISRTSVILPNDKLTKVERRILRGLEYYQTRGLWPDRTICIGISEVADGWTDGKTYICVNRNFLRRNCPNYYEASAHVIHLMFHEWAHDEDSTETHIHGEEFYRRFHELTDGGKLWPVGDFCGRMKSLSKLIHQEEVVAKEIKAKAARDKSLGLTAGGVAGVENAIAVKPVAAKVEAKPTKALVGIDGKPRRRKC